MTRKLGYVSRVRVGWLNLLDALGNVMFAYLEHCARAIGRMKPPHIRPFPIELLREQPRVALYALKRGLGYLSRHHESWSSDMDQEPSVLKHLWILQEES